MNKQKSRHGYALLIVLGTVVVIFLVLLGLMGWVGSSSKQVQRNNQFIASQYAAEAAVEKVISQMSQDYMWQSITSANYYASQTLNATNTAGWPVQYTLSTTNGTTGQISVNIGSWSTTTVPLGYPYQNLYATILPITITAVATPTGQRYNVPATIRESIQLASIPMFQFAIFYNLDLEIDPGSGMVIKGPVFSNGGIWSGAPGVSYQSSVQAAGTVDTSNNDPFDSNKSDSSGGTPSGNFASAPQSGANSINLPVAGSNTNSPATVRSVLNWPPAPYTWGTANAYSTNGQIYFPNKADLVISNAYYGTNWGGGAASIPTTNFFVYYQNSLNGSIIQWVTNDFYIVNIYTNNGGPYGKMYVTNYVASGILGTNSSHRATNIVYVGYTFLTNVLFYDAREGWNNGSGNGKPVQAVQFDVARFNAWLNNTNLDGSTNYNGGRSYNSDLVFDKNHPIDGIYIYTSVSTSQPHITVLPAVRVVNGAQLYDSHGLGIATPFPLYVKGNFNVQTDPSHSSAGQNSTRYAWPGAFYADAITILSDNWNDSATAVNPPSSRPPTSAITINAGCLEGIVQSDSSSSANVNSSGGYSGGLENFLRLLENWSGKTIWYNGSIVVMFPSQYATNRWNGGYYTVPTRKWAFDTNFLDGTKLPPMTPQAKAVTRGNWRVTN